METCKHKELHQRKYNKPFQYLIRIVPGTIRNCFRQTAFNLSRISFTGNSSQLLGGIIIFCTQQTVAQELKTVSKSYFKPVYFCQPFVSDLDNRKIDFELHYSTNYKSYDISNSGKDFKVFQTINLGADLPVFSKIVYNGGKVAHEVGIGMPISFNLWWDPFEETTSPVLNTSYKFGLINFKYIKYYSESKIRNISFRISPYNHESTHIGDELALYENEEGVSISRINVSYAYSEANITINDPNGSLEKGSSFRLGFKYRINGLEGFYTCNIPENDSMLTPPSGPNTELFAQYNLIRGKGFLSSAKVVNIISLEVRSKIRYGYDELKPIDEAYLKADNYEDQHELCLNAYVGWKFNYGAKTGFGVYIHGYTGVNPYGQFRNHSNYKSLGLSLIWD